MTQSPDALAEHAEENTEVVSAALDALERDFAAVDSIGPIRTARFSVAGSSDIEDAAADSHGYVEDLLEACRKRGLIER